jgi:hypothetical protein
MTPTSPSASASARTGCSIPTGGIAWHSIRQPIVLRHCRVDADPPVSPRFTTIASWRGAYAPMTHDGQTYSAKAHEFRKFVELPRLSSEAFEIALDIHPKETKDLRALTDGGWRLVSPRAVADTPETTAATSRVPLPSVRRRKACTCRRRADGSAIGPRGISRRASPCSCRTRDSPHLADAVKGCWCSTRSPRRRRRRSHRA